MCKKDDTRYEDYDGSENEEENPGLVGTDLVIEDERVQEAACDGQQRLHGKEGDIPRSGVDTIEHGYDEGGIIHLESTVQTYDLQDGCDGQEDDCEDGCNMPKLIPRIFVRETPGEQLDATRDQNNQEELGRYVRSLGKYKTATCETAATACPANSEDPCDLPVVLWCCPNLEFLHDPDREGGISVLGFPNKGGTRRGWSARAHACEGLRGDIGTGSEDCVERVRKLEDDEQREGHGEEEGEPSTPPPEGGDMVDVGL